MEATELDAVLCVRNVALTCYLVVQVARGLSTRHRHRFASLQPLVDVLAQQFDAHPGNYLAFSGAAAGAAPAPPAAA